ncbi:MAG: nucleotidyl transferase AbiEii/AbiGii toxin family protein [Deltaproteobacteria bacterium]|nr:nucleotidyl transferase AbiEii/AbiGii toxin family protein [Deltaproteobacteria bacterium]
MKKKGFFLAGGTAMGLLLKHRISRDLDWFTAQAFDAEALKKELSALGEKPTSIAQNSAHTVRAYYGNFETSFIAYRQVPPKVAPIKIGAVAIPVAKLEMLAVMKAAAVHDRGTKRDLIDVLEISKSPGWSLGRFIDHAAKNLPLAPSQVALALTYFMDAERDPSPEGYERSWSIVKKELEKGVSLWRRDQSMGR